jgi:hypothetical protein
VKHETENEIPQEVAEAVAGEVCKPEVLQAALWKQEQVPELPAGERGIHAETPSVSGLTQPQYVRQITMAFGSKAERECEKAYGHFLSVRNGKIVCDRCKATWVRSLLKIF